MARNAILQIRRNTEEGWTLTNPVLASGEIGCEVDTNRLKVGDGTTDWLSLNYISGGAYSTTENPPDSPLVGDVWFNVENGKTYIYYDNYWIEFGGESGPVGPEGPTGPIGPTGPTGPVAGTPITDSEDNVLANQVFS